MRRLLRQKKQALHEVLVKYGANNLRVFGSVAQGTAGPGSDFDLIVDLQNPPHGRLLARAGLATDLAQVLGCSVDIALASDSFVQEKVRKVMTV